MSFIKICTAVKGEPRQYQLDDLSIVIGDNGGGKSAVTQSLQLLATKTASGIRGRNNVKDASLIWEMFSTSNISMDVTGDIIHDGGAYSASVTSTYNPETGSHSRLAAELPPCINPDFAWLQPANVIADVVKAGDDKAADKLIDVIVETIKLPESELNARGEKEAAEKDWTPPKGCLNVGLAYYMSRRDALEKKAATTAKAAKELFVGNDHECPSCQRALGETKRAELQGKASEMAASAKTTKVAAAAYTAMLKREVTPILVAASDIATRMFPRMHAQWGVPTLAHGASFGVLGLTRSEDGIRRTALCGLEGLWAEMAMGLALYSLSEDFGKYYSFYVWPDIDIRASRRQEFMEDLSEAHAAGRLKTQIVFTSCDDVAGVSGWRKVFV